ncbi:MAG: lipoyl synthase [Methanomassiliicoccus sp.]|nr:lipoyl synthase [Methanomassiliicoccus sp.]
MAVGGKPDWLRVRAPGGETFTKVRELARRSGLHTVCDSSHCPNISDCWSRGHATFMILGRRCTRDCAFCAVEHGAPEPVDLGEPEHIAAAVRDLKLEHVVVTSVTRDDLPDQGAGQFRAVVEAIRELSPGTRVELLIPDMGSSRSSIGTVCASVPDVLGHNIETVERLQGVRDRKSSYCRSLSALSLMAELAPGAVIKSSLMLGLGETREEVMATLRDLRKAGVSAITMGQYLRPGNGRLEVSEYIFPGTFAELGEAARAMGFRHVASGPLVRSSYNAHEMLTNRTENHADR